MDIGGHPPHILGKPRLVQGDGGKYMEFDGERDGLIVDHHPLVGAETFTLEVVFQPRSEGLTEQRFVHVQEARGENRVLVETRLTGGGDWFLDTYIKSGEDQLPLFAEGHPHPIGAWYQAAVIYDGGTMRHYVDGEQELEGEVAFKPLKPGQTSLGVRLNRVCWFKGAMVLVRFVDRPLGPGEFFEVVK